MRLARILLPPLLLLISGCSSGDDRLESLVRSEPSLVRLERQVRWTVAAARDLGSPEAGPELDEEQRRWRKGLESCLEAEDPALCVAEAHRERLADLQERFALGPRQVAVHAAGAAGYEFRAIGNEPGWNLLLAEDHAVWETDYGQTRHELAGLEVDSVPGGRRWLTRLDGAELSIRVLHSPCADDMSGEEFDWTVEIQHGQRRLRGCADRTRPD